MTHGTATQQELSLSEALAYYVFTEPDYCTHRNGLTCGQPREAHPLVCGPEGEHSFLGQEYIEEVSAAEFDLYRQLATVQDDYTKTFIVTTKGERPFSNFAEAGREDVNGHYWHACDPYPHWYRHEADGSITLKSAEVAWA